MPVREILFSKWFYLLVFSKKKKKHGWEIIILVVRYLYLLRGFEENVLVTHHPSYVRSTVLKEPKEIIYPWATDETR
jgi:hypothetical protein